MVRIYDVPLRVTVVFSEAMPTRACCGNCGWKGDAKECQAIQHLLERVRPGEILPCGECPRCFALCHYHSVNLATFLNDLIAMVELHTRASKNQQIAGASAKILWHRLSEVVHD